MDFSFARALARCLQEDGFTPREAARGDRGGQERGIIRKAIEGGNAQLCLFRPGKLARQISPLLALPSSLLLRFPCDAFLVV